MQGRYHTVMLNGSEASPLHENRREILRDAQDDRATCKSFLFLAHPQYTQKKVIPTPVSRPE